MKIEKKAEIDKIIEGFVHGVTTKKEIQDIMSKHAPLYKSGKDKAVYRLRFISNEITTEFEFITAIDMVSTLNCMPTTHRDATNDVYAFDVLYEFIFEDEIYIKLNLDGKKSKIKTERSDY